MLVGKKIRNQILQFEQVLEAEAGIEGSYQSPSSQMIQHHLMKVEEYELKESMKIQIQVDRLQMKELAEVEKFFEKLLRAFLILKC